MRDVDDDTHSEQITHLTILMAILRYCERILKSQRIYFGEGPASAQMILELENITRDCVQSTAELCHLHLAHTITHRRQITDSC